MAMMVIDLLIALSLLGSHVRSDQVNTTVTIPPGSALQDYLCSGLLLKSNMTVVLEDGEHNISSESSCNIFNKGRLTITGSLDSTKRTVIRCESETRAVFAFVSVEMLAMERITFINCGIQLVSIEYTLIVNCTFQDSTSGAISSNTNALIDTLYGAVMLYGSTGNVSITDCTFQNNSVDDVGGAVKLYGSTGDVSITDCTFQNNSASYGGAVALYESTGDISITDCTFQNNSADGGGAVMLFESTGDVSVTSSTFQSNSAGNGGAVMLGGSTGDVSITDCIFQDNSASYGGTVALYESTGNISITDCTFQNNSADGGGAVMLFESTGDVSITGSTFQTNSASVEGGAVMLGGSTSNVCFTDCTFQNNSANNGGAVMLFESTGDVRITGSTFQNNSAGWIGGGGVMLLGSTCDVSITSSTFQNNSAFNGGAVMLYGSKGDVSITGSTFQNNSASVQGGAVMLLGSKSYVCLTDCTFQNNSADGGGAVMLFKSTGDVRITGSTFQNNSAGWIGGGAVMLFKSTCDVSITGSTFQSNSASMCGGAVILLGSLGTFQSNSTGVEGGAVMLDRSTGDVCLTDCTFQNNIAGWFGGAVMMDGSTVNVSITDCTLQNNSALKGGAVMLHGLKGDVSITSSTFQNNSGSFGGAMVLNDLSGGASIPVYCSFLNNSADDCARYAAMLDKGGPNVTITDCTFNINSGFVGGAIYIERVFYTMFRNVSITKNIAGAGAAIYAYGPTLDFLTSETEMKQLTLQDVVIKDNHCSYSTCTGAIYFKGMQMDIFGSPTTGSHFSYNSPQGAIQGDGGILTLHGYITFDHNTGVNGGAISLSNYAPLHFYPQNTIHFSNNAATGFGGAIYNDGKCGVNNKGFLLKYCILRIYISKAQLSFITFIDNHAQQGGHAVYATPIYDCVSRIDELFRDYTDLFNMMGFFNITPLPEDINETQVLSFPDNVNYCGCSDPNWCNGTSPNITTYPGRTVKLNITSVDQRNILSPGVVYTIVDTDGINSQNIMLGPRQKAQWIGTVCGQIEYQIYGPENASIKLLLSNNPNGYPTVINVKLLPCEPGFVFITNSSTSMMKCDCSPFLTSLGVICDTSDGTVTRNKTNWIGVYNNTLPALAQTCPLDYCNSTIKKLPLARPGYLCNGGRTGIICGHCHGNLSVIFGSSKCQICSDMWLTTLVMFAVLGVFLVAALFFLNLTITQGTLYGLIFYANIIQVNTSIFFNQSILNPLQMIVSLVNLDLGFPMCFYNGMDDADKAGLQFVFPAYLLILTMATILVCHYCLQRSPTTSTSLFLYKLSTIIGERAVGVLSTLIYLSYSKLLRTVIDILTYSTVHLPSGGMYVWFYDGNVEYLHGKHTALCVVAMVTCTLFLLPYTFALTFIPIIEQYREHNRLFNYLHNKANQIKPMNDAHYAPYKGEWRWWLGARLWLLVVMNSLNPVYSSDRPSLLLTIQATLVILFTITQAGIKPFGQPHQKTHQSNRCTNFYNQLYNSLDMFYLLNYTALAMSMSYILDQSSDQTQSAMVTVGVLVGLYVVMLMVTVLYHLIVAILKTCKMYDRTREMFNALFEKKQYDPMVPIELDDPTNSTASTTTVSVYCGLREPLSEYANVEFTAF